MTYEEFLQSKVVISHQAGFEAKAEDLHPSLFPHQRDVILWALRTGRALLAASFGLGKSAVQIELARLVHQHTGGKVLIVCPLGVRHQFIEEDGPRLGVTFRYVRTDAEVAAADTPFLITNYERVRDGDIDPRRHNIAGASLDEGCFAGGTVVDTPNGPRPIETLRAGDRVLSAAGVDKVVATTTRTAKRLVIVHVDGKRIVSSDNHLYLTRHGWKRAEQVKEGDQLVTQEKAVQILQSGIQAQASDESLLFQILRREMDKHSKAEAAALPNMRMVRQDVMAGTQWVDRVEILEPGDSRLDRYRGEDGQITLYDLQVERHPSFSVHGLLVHNSVLRSLGSKTYQVFEDVFAQVPYRFVCTATPSPNRYRELIYYAQFLGIMDSGLALTRWFKRDSTKAGNLTLHPHHERDFWLWVASWALFLYRPSDLGYSDEGYELPPLNIYWHRIAVDHRRAWEQQDHRGQRRLILDAAGSVLAAAREKRATLDARLAKMQEIIAAHPNRHWLLWHHLEDERRAICEAVPEATAVYGSQPLEEREARIIAFSHGEIPILATKPELAGSGCNFQRHCHSAVYLGVDYKFEDLIQSIHRLYRFQQRHPVDIHIIYAESEDQVVEALQQKWQRHNELAAKMQEIIRKYGLSHAAMKRDLTRNIGVQRVEVKGQHFTAIHNDCVRELPNIASDSVGLIHSSIPFGNHFEYSAQYEDFGHNPTDGDFWRQMDFLIPQLLRVLMPGRVAAIHVKDRILYGHQTQSGFMEVSPFSDECVSAFRKHGFLYEGRRTIVTDVVRENASTYRLGYSEMRRDASKMGSGLPEYLLLFRKPPSSADNAYADTPVVKDKATYSRARWQLDAHCFWRSNGNILIVPDLYDHEAHVARLEERERNGALPASFFVEPPKSHSEWVWDDIVHMRTLNTNQSQKRREAHLCPLPLDIVERAIRLYSNEGDVVLDPFAGLFTVPYVAIQMRRYGMGVELNPVYFEAGARYCQEMELRVSAPTLFDLLETERGEQDAHAA